VRALLFVVALLVGGCAALQPGGDDAARVDAVIAEAVRVSRLPAAEQGERLALARQAFEAGHDDLDRLRLATLLATLSPPLGDDAQAAKLLAPLGSGHGDSAVGRFAGLLSVQLAERQRLEQALGKSQEQTETLQKKLDELNSIEHKALRREEQLQ
jgi:hypothetical protein